MTQVHPASHGHLILVCGVRPQYIKAAALQFEIERAAIEFGQRPTITVVDTAQHYSPAMASNIMSEIGLQPNITFTHSRRTSPAEVLGSAIQQLADISADWAPTSTFVVFGDANPAFAGATVAMQNGFRLAHVEAGERRPGEVEHHNSRTVALGANLALCVTEDAVANLGAEKFGGIAIHTGDMASRWRNRITSSGRAIVAGSNDVVVTLHRPENMDLHLMRQLAINLLAHGKSVHWILHPRSEDLVRRATKDLSIKISPPMGFGEIFSTIDASEFIVSDSGGVVREAHLLGKPALIVNTGVWSCLELVKAARRVSSDLSRFDEDIQWAENAVVAPLGDSPLLSAKGIDQGIDELITLSQAN